MGGEVYCVAHNFLLSDLLSGKGPQQGVAVNLEAPAYFIHHANLH